MTYICLLIITFMINTISYYNEALCMKHWVQNEMIIKGVAMTAACVCSVRWLSAKWCGLGIQTQCRVKEEVYLLQTLYCKPDRTDWGHKLDIAALAHGTIPILHQEVHMLSLQLETEKGICIRRNSLLLALYILTLTFWLHQAWCVLNRTNLQNITYTHMNTCCCCLLA